MDITLIRTGLEQGELIRANTMPITKGCVSGIDLNTCGMGILNIFNNERDIAKISNPTIRFINTLYSLKTEKASPPKTPSNAITTATQITKEPALIKACFLHWMFKVPM